MNGQVCIPKWRPSNIAEKTVLRFKFSTKKKMIVFVYSNSYFDVSSIQDNGFLYHIHCNRLGGLTWCQLSCFSAFLGQESARLSWGWSSRSRWAVIPVLSRSQSCLPVRLWERGRIPFQGHSGCWQDSRPLRCGRKSLDSPMAVNQTLCEPWGQPRLLLQEVHRGASCFLRPVSP